MRSPRHGLREAAFERVYGGFIRMAGAVCLAAAGEMAIVLAVSASDSASLRFLTALSSAVWATAAILFIAGVLRAVFGFIDYAQALRQEAGDDRGRGDQ